MVATSTYNNGDQNDEYGLSFVNRLGGVFFTDLRPAAFWDTLGFTAEHNAKNLFFGKSQIVQFNNNVIINEFESRTTKQIITNSMYRRTDIPIAAIESARSSAVRRHHVSDP